MVFTKTLDKFNTLSIEERDFSKVAQEYIDDSTYKIM